MHFNLASLLRSIIRADSRPSICRELTSAVAESRSVVLVRVWLVDNAGDLQLVSSAGTPSGGGSYTRLDGEFREMAVADSKLRAIAQSRDPFIVRGIRGDEEWLTNSAWAARQGVRAFTALPLVACDEIVGLLAAFDRDLPDADVVGNLSLVCDVAAARLGDLGRGAEGRRSLAGTEVLTRADMRQKEKENVAAALARTNGKVFGRDGAAALLGMRPTTLASRVKVLGLRPDAKPRGPSAAASYGKLEPPRRGG